MQVYFLSSLYFLRKIKKKPKSITRREMGMCKYFKQSFAADHCYTCSKMNLSFAVDVKFEVVHLLESVFHYSRVFGNAGKDKFTHLTSPHSTITKNFKKRWPKLFNIENFEIIFSSLAFA